MPAGIRLAYNDVSFRRPDSSSCFTAGNVAPGQYFDRAGMNWLTRNYQCSTMLSMPSKTDLLRRLTTFLLPGICFEDVFDQLGRVTFGVAGTCHNDLAQHLADRPAGNVCR